MEYLPTFTLKITQFCRKIYHTWSMWDIYPDYMRTRHFSWLNPHSWPLCHKLVATPVMRTNLAMNRKGMGLATLQVLTPHISHDHWVGLRENLQETIVLSIKYRAFL